MKWIDFRKSAIRAFLLAAGFLLAGASGSPAEEIGIVLSNRHGETVAKVDQVEHKLAGDEVLQALAVKFKSIGDKATVTILARTGVAWDAIFDVESTCHKVGFRNVKCYLLSADGTQMTEFHTTAAERQPVPDWFAERSATVKPLAERIPSPGSGPVKKKPAQ